MQFTFLLSTRAHDPHVAQELAHKLGYDGIELVLPWEDALERKNVAQYEKLQQVKAIHAPMTDFDAERFMQSLQYAVDVAERLDVPLINIHPPALKYGGRANIEAGYAAVQQAAKKSGRTIALEVLPTPGKPKHARQQSYEHPRQWVDDLQQLKLAGTLDTTHIASWNLDPADYIKPLGQQLQHIHVSDYEPATQEEHLFIGEGAINFQKFFDELRQLSQGQIAITLEQKNRYDITEASVQALVAESLRLLKSFTA